MQAPGLNRTLRRLLSRPIMCFGQIPGLAPPPVPGTEGGISLVARLQNHDEARTGYARRDLLLVDNEEMF